MTAPRAAVPSPRQWVEALARQGIDVTWRVAADYTGLFLERPSRLTEHDQGIFVRYLGVDDAGITV